MSPQMAPLVGYKAWIRDPERRILMLEDSVIRHGLPFNFWDLPGGKPEGDEDPRMTVRRETKEETWLDVVVRDLIGSYNIKIVKGIVRCDVYEAITDNYDVDIHRNTALDETILSYAWLHPAEAIKRRMSKSLRQLIIRIGEGELYE